MRLLYLYCGHKPCLCPRSLRTPPPPPPAAIHAELTHVAGAMASAERWGLLSAVLAMACLGVSGFSSGDLVFLKSNTGAPFDLQLVVRVPCPLVRRQVASNAFMCRLLQAAPSSNHVTRMFSSKLCTAGVVHEACACWDPSSFHGTGCISAMFAACSL